LNNNQIQSTVGTTTTPSNWVLSTTGDFNRDGRSDVVWWDPNRKIAVIHYYNGNSKVGEANLEAW